jgi:cellulose synthase/poly-beta-1,6-N-acetylglucosamine synthase-like glycosyltransferase
MAIALIIVYTLSLVLIFAYSMMQLHLVISYMRFHRKKRGRNAPDDIPEMADEDLPPVTVQLPVFNEMYVVERLIDRVAHFDYPADKLEIQVLDDSTDETVELSRKKVAEWKQKGIDIKLLTRKERTGFKAGALQEGLKTARGEYVAIFDADFVPKIDFLKRTVPHFFQDPKLGAVQTRWEHLNKSYSLLTRVQAFALDAHFTVEQQGRNAGGYFINFNGTAGIWKRECIEDAGGWQADTLTEDLDLSYRAQIKGWKFKYLEHVTSPAELPLAMSAIKSQQFRWTKGGAETARKVLRQIWSSDIRLGQKLHGTAHLLSSSIFLLVLICSVLSIPVLLIKNALPEYSDYFLLMTFFVVSLMILSVFYYCSFYRRFHSRFRAFIYLAGMFPMFLAMSMGISLHNTVAVLEGYLGFKSPFIRTPKFNISSSAKSAAAGWRANKYLKRNLGRGTLAELFLAAYFLAGIVVGFLLHDYGLLPFHIMLATGFGLVSYYSVKHSRVS